MPRPRRGRPGQRGDFANLRRAGGPAAVNQGNSMMNPSRFNTLRPGARPFPRANVITLLFLLGSAVLVPAREDSERSPWERSIVTVELNAKQYDYRQPWITRTKTTQKNGLVIGPREILTTAEDFSNRTLVRIQKNGRGKWYNATVQWVDYHANLASVTADDETRS